MGGGRPVRTDIVIVGAGPAGIFTALELLKQGARQRIVMVEKGAPVEKRHCPKGKTGYCVNCKPYCHITTGFSGAGAFSDGKLSLSYEVGGQLPELIGEAFAQQMIDYTDEQYLAFGADEKVEGLEATEQIKAIRTRAIRAGLKLVDCPIRHLGTERAQALYGALQRHLLDQGVEILFGHDCNNLILKDGACLGVQVEKVSDHSQMEILAGVTVVATGRRGADWLEKICEEHHIAHQPGTVDIGVRVEVRTEVMEEVNEALYESKLVGYPAPFRDKVRTFCQNPGGFVSQENYDNDLAVVNGHSYKERKSKTPTCPSSAATTSPIPSTSPSPTRRRWGADNMLANGRILVQRWRHPGRQAHLGEGAGPRQRAAHAAGRRGRGYHRRHALSCHDQHHQLHPRHG